MAWPKGVPKKGYKKSGLSLSDWVSLHSPASPPRQHYSQIIEEKVLDTSPPFVYSGYKDEWGRLFIQVRLEDKVLLEEQWTPPTTICEQALRMTGEIEDA